MFCDGRMEEVVVNGFEFGLHRGFDRIEGAGNDEGPWAAMHFRQSV